MFYALTITTIFMSITMIVLVASYDLDEYQYTGRRRRKRSTTP